MNRLIFFSAWMLVFKGLSDEYEIHKFVKLQLSNHFWSEGAAVGDFNRDGRQDVVSGPYWWEGSEFVKRHTFYPDHNSFRLSQSDDSMQIIPGFPGALSNKNAYSNNFLAFVYDFNKDGWDDVLVIGFPGKASLWYENPKVQNQLWKAHLALKITDNESPHFTDLTGDGLPEIVCSSEGRFGFASPDWDSPTKPWTFFPISPKGDWNRFTHGLGVGDVNGDGRKDLLEKDGWWEQPLSENSNHKDHNLHNDHNDHNQLSKLSDDSENSKLSKLSENSDHDELSDDSENFEYDEDRLWKFHPVSFSPGGGAQMYVYDVDGDGDGDVITSLAAHGYGLAWFEQKRKGDEIAFEAHVFLNKEVDENRYGVSFSQLHAIDLADMNGDGLLDIITGKRFWAHGPFADAEPNSPAVLYWFELDRSNGKVDYIPHLVDDDSGIGTQVLAKDMNGDGFPEIIVGNKKGTFVHFHKVIKTDHSTWKNAQPKVITR